MRKSTIQAIQRSLVIAGLGLLLAGVAARLSEARHPTLPQPIWGTFDDVQCFPAGTEFNLSREAAAIEAAEADASRQNDFAMPPGLASDPLPIPGPIPLAPHPPMGP